MELSPGLAEEKGPARSNYLAGPDPRFDRNGGIRSRVGGSKRTARNGTLVVGETQTGCLPCGAFRRRPGAIPTAFSAQTETCFSGRGTGERHHFPFSVHILFRLNLRNRSYYCLPEIIILNFGRFPESRESLLRFRAKPSQD